MMDKDININGIITDLDDLCKRLQDNYNDGVPFEQSEEDRLTVYNAIELLEKQIPKKVILVEEECNCPNCLFDMMGVFDFSTKETTDPKFCPECGQALDWSDTE